MWLPKDIWNIIFKHIHGMHMIEVNTEFTALLQWDNDVGARLFFYSGKLLSNVTGEPLFNYREVFTGDCPILGSCITIFRANLITGQWKTTQITLPAYCNGYTFPNRFRTIYY